jgi:two-component system LytT family sensor kinase
MSELLNLIGLSTGVVLYAMLLAMVVRRDHAAAPSKLDPLLVATALLGVLWNLSALPVYELPRLGVRASLAPVSAIGFAALGFLPAVVVHSVLRGADERMRGRSRYLLAAVAYAISATAALLHARALWAGEAVPAPLAMRTLTYAYLALALPVAAQTRGQAGARRTLWIAALSIFAVSALHLSQVHQGDGSWPIELLGHHASVPLALAILYQDYPFALADLFLKRALTLLSLIAIAFLSVTALHATSGATRLGGPREVGSLVVLWVATALLYPRLRGGIGWFVDNVVLKRPDYPAIIARIAQSARAEQDVAALLDRVCQELTPALSARTVTWREITGTDPNPRQPADLRSLSAAVEVPVTETPQYLLVVGGLTGGRRLLSDDHAALQAIASIVGRRIDALRLTRERYARQLRDHEMSKLAAEAELRALRSQINPHFLFNALTTIGYLIQTAPERALDTLLRLTALLRGVLRSEGEFTTLGRELDLIESYLDIERARFDERLTAAIEVPGDLRSLRIPPLLLQPIVENAIKHGIAPKPEGGRLLVRASLDGTGPRDMLVLVVRDTGLGAAGSELRRGRMSGVGLSNVERRLGAHYGDSASLRIDTAVGTGTTVEIRLPAERRPGARVLPLAPGRGAS